MNTPSPSDGKKLNPAQQWLLARIAHAFAGVELGEGVSMHETKVIDDYGTDEEYQAARALDEQFDWRKVIDDPYPTQELSMWAFLDAAGMRFYLPACMTRVVRDGDHADDAGTLAWYMGIHLSGIGSDYHREQLSLLNDEQKACVREVLIYMRDYLPEWWGGDEELARSLDDGYWLEQAQS
jgi:hypothetical protein